jgi:hypothetical protein
MENQTEHVIKLSGKATLPEPIAIGHNYTVEAQGSVISSARHDNQDGSYTEVYTFKPIIVSVLKETGETIKAKDVRSRSVQLRSAMWKEWKNLNTPIEFETYYDAEMVKLIQARNIH